jgi:hypothetical protein
VAERASDRDEVKLLMKEYNDSQTISSRTILMTDDAFKSSTTGGLE